MNSKDINRAVASLKRLHPTVHERATTMTVHEQVTYLHSKGWARDRENLKGWWRRNGIEPQLYPLKIAIRLQISAEEQEAAK